MPRAGVNLAQGGQLPSGSLHTLAGGAIIVAALYFARDVLVPVSLALLLTFLLAPAVVRLRRFGLARVPAVIVTVSVAFSAIGLVGWVVAGQLLHLANELPSYQQNISEKLRAFNTPSGGLIERTGRMLSELNRDIAGAEEATPAMPVTIQQPPASPLDTLEAFVTPLLDPLATAGVVVVLVIFMLIGREDLRDRFIGLVGTSRMNVTTQALDDAGGRISRYLLMQLLVNVAYGVPFGVGLYLIGVPNALLWGVLATLLRFVPYLGPLIAMALPLLLAFAVDPGWSMLLMTAGLFLVLELTSNNVVEPWLYGASTGISSVAIMVAAVFWTWLWGPIGLLMSTPLTVCLAVAGRYVPHLSFLSVLLGNEPALKPEVRLYQRMLAMDFAEASEIAGELLEELPLIQVYGELVIPALSLAESDRHEGLLDEEHKRFIIDNTRELVTELAEVHAARSAVREQPLAAPAHAVVVIPARDESDELAGLMLRELVRQSLGLEPELRPASEPLDAHLAYIRQKEAPIVLVSSVPPSAVRHAAYAVKRLKAALPEVRVVVGLWSIEADAARLRSRLPEPLVEGLFTRLDAAVGWIGGAVTPPGDAALAAPPVPADEAARLEALRRTRLLDTPPEEAFDRVTRRLSQIFDAPISLMSLIDETRQFWKSQHGLPADLAAARAHSRETSVCGYVVAGNETVVVEDAWLDQRFAGNPFLRERNIRFYAGAPLKTSEGQAIGSLCIIDHRPRRITDRERQLLELMADTVMAEVEALVLAREHADRRDPSGAPEVDFARARALQAALAPPAQQVIGRTILVHRGPGGDGAASGFLVMRQGHDGRIAIAIGDAAAAGLSGALTATAIAATAGRLLEEHGGAGEVLAALNASSCGECAVPLSITVAVLWPRDDRLDVASAGYCPPILVHAAAAAPLEVPIQPPLFSDSAWNYSSGTTSFLDPGDRVLLYTDPAVDVSGATEDLIGVDGLVRIAAEHSHEEPERFIGSVETELLQLNAGRHDGWWLLAIDHRPATAPPPPPEESAVPAEGESLAGAASGTTGATAA